MKALLLSLLLVSTLVSVAKASDPADEQCEAAASVWGDAVSPTPGTVCHNKVKYSGRLTDDTNPRETAATPVAPSDATE